MGDQAFAALGFDGDVLAGQQYVIGARAGAAKEDAHRPPQQMQPADVARHQQRQLAVRDRIGAVEIELLKLIGADRDKGHWRFHPVGLAVDGDRHFERLVDRRHRHDHRPIGRQPAAAPVLVDAFAHAEHRGIGAEAGVVEKDPAVHLADRDRAGVALERRGQRLFRVFRQAQAAREIVEGAHRQDSQRDVGAGQGGGQGADGAIAAGGDDRIAAFGQGGVDGVAQLRRGRHLTNFDPGEFRRGGADCVTPVVAAPRRGIENDTCAHLRSLSVVSSLAETMRETGLGSIAGPRCGAPPFRNTARPEGKSPPLGRVSNPSPCPTRNKKGRALSPAFPISLKRP